MYNIVNQCVDIEKQTSITEDGLIISMKATHLLLTQDQYNTILKSAGIKVENMITPLKELYGLQLLFTDIPLSEPRVLSMNK